MNGEKQIIVYGSNACKDTLYAMYKLSENGGNFYLQNITGDMKSLRDFLIIRDTTPEIYDTVRANGGIGMPLFILPDGTKTLDLDEAIMAMK